MIVSYLGSFGGGIGVIKFGWDFLVIAIYSMFIMWLAYASSLTKEKIALLLPSEKELDLIL
jgi:hypothetical protein